MTISMTISSQATTSSVELLAREAAELVIAIEMEIPGDEVGIALEGGDVGNYPMKGMMISRD